MAGVFGKDPNMKKSTHHELERLNQEVAAARPPKAQPHLTLSAKAQAWFGFYARNPRDLDLGFYLVQGLAPRGLTSELNQSLNARLHDGFSDEELHTVARWLRHVQHLDDHPSP